MNTKATEPLEQDEVVDSRDVMARIEYLQSRQAEEDPSDPFTDEEEQELTELLALQAEASDYAADWEYGETLIRDDYFTEYAQELAEDIGAIDPNTNWPLNCIDWEQASRELKMDYTSVEWAGTTYWIR